MSATVLNVNRMPRFADRKLYVDGPGRELRFCAAHLLGEGEMAVSRALDGGLCTVTVRCLSHLAVRN